MLACPSVDTARRNTCADAHVHVRVHLCPLSRHRNASVHTCAVCALMCTDKTDTKQGDNWATEGSEATQGEPKDGAGGSTGCSGKETCLSWEKPPITSQGLRVACPVRLEQRELGDVAGI